MIMIIMMVVEGRPGQTYFQKSNMCWNMNSIFYLAIPAGMVYLNYLHNVTFKVINKSWFYLANIQRKIQMAIL